MKNIGLFGGSFNPPHCGHIHALKAFCSAASLDFVYIMPAGIPPHKTIEGASGKERMEMAKIAFSDIAIPFEVSDFEIQKAGKSYTADTLSMLKECHPHDQLFLYVGTDMFRSLESWYSPEKIFSFCTICCMARNEGEWDENDRYVALYEEKYSACIIKIPDYPLAVSSTEIRAGKSQDKLPEKVRIYAQTAGLYRREIPKSIAVWLDTLSDKRREHSIGVAEEALTLALLLQADAPWLFEAALLHDITREKDLETQREIALRMGGLNEDEFCYPLVVHGKTAALIARCDFHLSDEAVSAISYHTTAREGMTLPEKILYFADYIEPNRKHAVCMEARRRFYEGLPADLTERRMWLDHEIWVALSGSVLHLQENKLSVHPDTLKAKIALERMIQGKETL